MPPREGMDTPDRPDILTRARQLLHRPALRAALVAVVLALALATLAAALRAHSYREVRHALRALPAARLALAVGLAALAYVVMTGYDALALRYVGRPLPWRRSAFVSFTSYALSGTVGISLLTGGSIRLGLYTAAGLSAAEVGGVIAFGAATLWLGLLALAGVTFVVLPPALAGVAGAVALRTTGALALAAVAAYLAWAWRGRPLRVRGFAVRPPALPLALAQLGLSLLDWALSIAVLGVLLGPGVPAGRLAGTYLLAQGAGLASHVPAGLGVFDSIVVLGLGGAVGVPAVLAALLGYRLAYHALPAAVAAVLLAGAEMAARRQALGRAARLAGRWAGEAAPQLLATATFAAGTLLLVNGAAPELRWRLAWLGAWLPFGVIEASHFTGSLVGTGLLIVALGLQRRLAGAWLAATALLATGSVASLLHGAWGAALLLVPLVAALASARRFFHRPSSLVDERFTPGWLVSIGAAVGAATWLGFFAYRHVEYRSELWWHFALLANAPRFLRATVGTVAVLLAFAAWKLLRPPRARTVRPVAADLERARAIVLDAAAPEANLALLGDKTLLFNEAGTAFLMYGVRGRTWVALGDPVGPREAWADLLWRFREEVDRHGGRPVFYRVTPEALPLYLDLGLGVLKLGEEATVDLATFSLEGRARADLRYVLRRLAKQDVRFEVREAGASDALLPRLRAISDAWLARKRVREKGFSLGTFDPGYLRRFPLALVWQGETLVAFATLWVQPASGEVTVDLMRHDPAAPAGVMEFLFGHLLGWAKAQGHARFSLGMVPLAGLAPRPLAPRWHRLAHLVFAHGERFYNFRGLRAFKDGFHPEWLPRYIAVPRGVALPFVLADVTALIGGGVKGALAA